jgi:exodeoxyribonuclease-3
MKLISWNVNGLRAVHRNGYWKDFLKLDADIFCLQEVKAEKEQLPEEMQNIPEYQAFFNHSKTRKGYSGVAIYSKLTPEKVEYSLGVDRLDQEGRLIALYFKEFVLFNVYFPNGGGGPERLAYKLDFYDEFLLRIQKIRSSGLPIIFCGDINTAHEAIDLARPKENETNTGFLPEERAWLDEVERSGYIDTFRRSHPGKGGLYSYWDIKTRARDRNIGWRIDYFFVSQELEKKVKKASILDSVYGSDHCPVQLEIEL